MRDIAPDILRMTVWIAHILNKKVLFRRILYGEI